jgi:hypothetical protein
LLQLLLALLAGWGMCALYVIRNLSTMLDEVRDRHTSDERQAVRDAREPLEQQRKLAAQNMVDYDQSSAGSGCVRINADDGEGGL